MNPQLFVRLAASGLRRDTGEQLLGWVWWLVDPLVMIGVYAIVFGAWLDIGRVSAHGAYPLFLACALVPWRWFSMATIHSAGALRRNVALITSLPVAREAIVLGEFTAISIRGLLGLPILVIFMLGYQSPITTNLLFVPLALALMGTLALGLAYALAPLTAILPDLSNGWAMALRVGWFLSPGLYGLSQVPEALQGLYTTINPLAGILEGIRRPVHDGLPPHWTALACSAVWAGLVLLSGRWLFHRTVRRSVRFL